MLHMDEGGSIVSVEYGQPGGGCRTRSEGPVQLPARLARAWLAHARLCICLPGSTLLCRSRVETYSSS